ncbi:FecR domain-containing protein [Proteiniphilum sp.]|uniref:FecR domain-containing protein n=1 Tax=Proteiniphilum sp. TaxID=1926877 RepID=UPI00331BE716
MFHSKNNREGYMPDRGGKDERSRIEWFLFVHQLLDRFESGKASKKEKQFLSLWNPLLKEQLSVLPDGKEEKDAERKIYRKISEHFPSVVTDSNESIPVQSGRSAKPSILLSFPVIMIIILLAGFGMYFGFNQKERFLQRSTDIPPFEDVVFNTGEGENREFVLPDGTFVKMNDNTVISFCSDEFNKTARKVELIQGEAVFITVEGDDTPFVVESNTGSVIMKSPTFKIRVAETGTVEIIPEK